MTPRPRLSPEAWRALAGGAAFWLSVASLTAWGLWRERVQAVEFARMSAMSTVTLMEQHTSTTFRAVELALEDTADRVAAAPLPRHDESTRAAMRSHLAGMPYVRALFVIGPDGFIQHDTDYPKTPDVSLADRDYFKAYLADPARASGISAPLLSRSGTGWFVAATRRIGPPGDLKGVAVAAIQLGYFGELYARMGQLEGVQIALFHRDGRLMAWYPPTEAIPTGTSFANYPLFKTHLPLAPSGSFTVRGEPLGFQRIVAYRAVSNEPLVVALAYDLDAALGPWRRTVAGAAAALGLLLLLTAAAVALLVRGEAERRRTRERIAQGEKLEALGRLTGSIAHDFGNVLGVIGNNLALVSALTQGGDERVKAAVDGGRRAVATGSRLTRDLMSFARKRELQLARADLSELVAQMRPMLEQAAGSRVTIDTSLAVGLWHCEVDYTQLQVTMINLVANARDAMGGTGRIVVKTFNREGRPASVCLSVMDEGAGMTEEVRARALEPFFTTKGEQGTGLGLSQVYGFMSQLGGEVEIASAPGQGTEVRLLFRALRD